MDCLGFKKWLEANTSYSSRVISNVVSRLHRANRFYPIRLDEFYIFRLGQIEEFASLSRDVKSQIRRAVRLYFMYAKMVALEEEK